MWVGHISSPGDGSAEAERGVPGERYAPCVRQAAAKPLR